MPIDWTEPLFILDHKGAGNKYIVARQLSLRAPCDVG